MTTGDMSPREVECTIPKGNMCGMWGRWGRCYAYWLDKCPLLEKTDGGNWYCRRFNKLVRQEEGTRHSWRYRTDGDEHGGLTATK